MISLNRQELKVVANRLSVVARNSGSDQPLMGEAKDGVLTLWYNGLDLAIWHEMEADEDIDLFSIPVDRFTRLINSWSQDIIKLSVTGSNLNMQCGRSRIKIPFYEGAFDEIEDIPEGYEVCTLPLGTVNALSNSLKFVSKVDLGNPILSTVNVRVADEQLSILATDRFHLYRNVFDGIENLTDKDVNMIIPEKSVNVLSTLLSEDMTLSLVVLERGYIIVETDDGFTLRLATTNGAYPDVSRVFDQEFNEHFYFTKSELSTALKAGEVLADDNRVALEVLDDNVCLSFPRSTAESELYLETLEFIDNTPMVLHLNVLFLSQLLDVYDSDTLVFGRNATNKIVAVSESGRDNVMALAMEFYVDN